MYVFTCLHRALLSCLGDYNSRLRPLMLTVTVALASLFAVNPAHALRQGATSASVGVSAGHALGRNYTVLTARLGYFLADGLEFSVSGEMWRGNDPDIYRVSPEMRYIWFHLPRVKPYVGAFYGRTIYDGVPDRNTYGFKGGIYMPISPNAHLVTGLVYERIEKCNEAIYRDCSEIYPEVSLSVSF